MFDLRAEPSRHLSRQRQLRWTPKTQHRLHLLLEPPLVPQQDPHDLRSILDLPRRLVNRAPIGKIAVCTELFALMLVTE